jgi:hypothetical protein
MANPDAPFGARILKNKGGTHPTVVNTYRIANAYATAIYYGDWVKTTTDGTLVIATAGDAVRGVFLGCDYVDSSGVPQFKRHWTASTATLGSLGANARVADDPSIIVEMQSDGSMTSADIGQFCDIDTSQTGTQVVGSKQQASATGSTEDNFKILGVYGVAPYEKPCRNAAGDQDMLAGGTNAVVILSVVNHELGGAAVGVEV